MDQWWRPDSEFALYARNVNIIPYHKEPFEWSGDIDGAFLDLFGERKHRVWKATGAAISYYCESIPFSHRNIIAHSHAIQCLAYAAQRHGLQIKNLITISPPLRKDMLEGYRALGKLTENWLNIHDEDLEFVRFMGQLFDGGSTDTIIPFAVNHSLPDINHSRILKDVTLFPLWISQGWFDYLRL